MIAICFIVHNINGSGGDTKVATEIINGLAKKSNYRISVISIEHEKTYRQNLYSLDSRVDVKYVTSKIVNLKKEFISISLKIRNIVKTNQYDAIIVSGMDFVPFLSLSLKTISHVKAIAWEHMNYNVNNNTLLKIGRYIAMHYFDNVVTITKRDQSLYQSNNPEQSSKIVQIYNPLNYPKREKSNLAEKKILSCGLLVEQKGFDLAIEIAAKVLPLYPDWSWEIWGDGPMFDELNAKIADYNLSNRLRLLGYTDSMIEKYSNYSIFAMTSRFEGFGMVLSEALSCGVPAISFDIDAGPNEMIKNAENGYLIPAFDLNSYAEKLSEMMNDSTLRTKMQENSDVLIKCIDYDDIIAKWITLIEE